MNNVCPKCNSDMWDNRLTKRNPKQPDFKCKNVACAHPVWLQHTNGITASTTPPLPAPRDTFVEPKRESISQPNWDEIAKGKVRHGFAIEAFKLRLPLTEETKMVIDEWTDFVLNGK